MKTKIISLSLIGLLLFLFGCGEKDVKTNKSKIESAAKKATTYKKKVTQKDNSQNPSVNSTQNANETKNNPNSVQQQDSLSSSRPAPRTPTPRTPAPTAPAPAPTPAVRKFDYNSTLCLNYSISYTFVLSSIEVADSFGSFKAGENQNVLKFNYTYGSNYQYAYFEKSTHLKIVLYTDIGPIDIDVPLGIPYKRNTVTTSHMVLVNKNLFINKMTITETANPSFPISPATEGNSITIPIGQKF